MNIIHYTGPAYMVISHRQPTTPNSQLRARPPPRPRKSNEMQSSHSRVEREADRTRRTGADNVVVYADTLPLSHSISLLRAQTLAPTKPKNPLRTLSAQIHDAASQPPAPVTAVGARPQQRASQPGGAERHSRGFATTLNNSSKSKLTGWVVPPRESNTDPRRSQEAASWFKGGETMGGERDGRTR